LIICREREGEQPGFRSLGACRNGAKGWQYVREDGSIPEPGPEANGVDWDLLARQCERALTPELKQELADSLGVPLHVLDELDIGFDAISPFGAGWTFREKTVTGATIGLCLRRRIERKKFSYGGGKRGLILPKSWEQTPGDVFIPEGQSDVLAGIAMARRVIGRPFNSGGREQLAKLFGTMRISERLIILGENDGGPGKACEPMAKQLEEALARPIYYAYPPGGKKDLRQWFCDQKPDLACADHLHDLGQRFTNSLELHRAKQHQPEAWEPPIAFAEFPRPEFPTECLSVICVNFVTGVAHFTQTPPDLAAMLILGVCGAALAKKVRVVIRPGWTEPTNLYALVALDSGNRKSAVFEKVLEPVQAWEQEEVERTREQIAEMASARRLLEGRLKHTEAAAAKTTAAAERSQLASEARNIAKELSDFQMPVEPQFLADDTTVEKLASLMAERDERMLIASPEGTIFDIVKGKYSDSPNFGVFLTGHSGDRQRVQRMGREGDFMKQPALSMAISPQPDVIMGLMKEATLRARGFLARPLYSLPESLLGKREVKTAAVPLAVANAYRELILDIWKLPGALDGKKKLLAIPVSFSSDSDNLMVEFQRRLEPRLGPDGDLFFIKDWAGKLAGAAARIAGILHVTFALEEGIPWQCPIEAKTVEAAICIAEDYLLPHAVAAFGLMGADRNLENAKRLLKWLKEEKRQTFSRRDAHRAIQSWIEKADDLEPVLKLLLNHGYLRERESSGTGERGRRPSPVYGVNPALWNEGGR
jgi:hypothetical protein